MVRSACRLCEAAERSQDGIAFPRPYRSGTRRPCGTAERRRDWLGAMRRKFIHGKRLGRSGPFRRSVLVVQRGASGKPAESRIHGNRRGSGAGAGQGLVRHPDFSRAAGLENRGPEAPITEAPMKLRVLLFAFAIVSLHAETP